MILDQVISTLY